MDWQSLISASLVNVVSNRTARALGLLGVVAFAILALQWNRLGERPPSMCELINDCQLRYGDLQRIQVALGQSGFSDYRIDGQTLLVPREQHADYLKAISDYGALPKDLQNDGAQAAAINPLLSRSQQQAVERERKKQQVREMILRLPFVQQAWLEIDSTRATSPFQPSQQSAVISIRPAGDNTLDAQQVNTIRRMLTGAVAGLGPQAIEVIDLSEGVAKQGFTGALVDPQQHALEAQQRTDQQRRLRSKILAALQRFPGVEVDVRLTQCKFQSRENSLPTVVPAKPQMQLTAGSNGVASIIASAASPQPPVQSVGFDRSQETNTCEVAVQVDLPEVALENIAMSLMLRPTLDSVGQKRDVVGEKFAVIRPQIQQEVASLLPAAWRDQSGPSPVQVTLHRAEVAKAVTVSDRAMQMARQHWPSVAALLVGLTLLSIVLRKPASDQVTDAATAEPNVLPMSLAEGNPAPDSQTKEQLDRLLQDHPEAAARALEDWVRNAG